MRGKVLAVRFAMNSVAEGCRSSGKVGYIEGKLVVAFREGVLDKDSIGANDLKAGEIVDTDSRVMDCCFHDLIHVSSNSL